MRSDGAKRWLLLSTVLLPGCTCLLAPSLNARRRGISAASSTGDDVSDAIDLINQCANSRSAKPDDVVAALAVLRAERPRPPTRESFGGVWELVWNDKLAKVPVVNGYMPNRETLTWDLDAGTITFVLRDKLNGTQATVAAIGLGPKDRYPVEPPADAVSTTIQRS